MNPAVNNAIRSLRLGSAFGSFCGAGSVISLGATDGGRETMRYLRALRAGLSAMGCSVLELGILPLSTQRLLARESGANGGMTLHNGKLELTGPNGTVWEDWQEFLCWEECGDFCGVPPSELGEIKTVPRGFSVHLRKLSAAVDVEQIRACGIKAVCCAPDAAGICAEEMLRKWNCTALSAADPEELSRLMIAEKAQIGFLLDGGGSYCRICGNSGILHSPQITAALVLEHLLEAFPDPAAITRSTGKFAEKTASEWGCALFYAPGDTELDLWETMRQNSITLGCDGASGGVLWKRVQNTFDAFAVMALLLEMLALSNMEIDTIIHPIQEKVI